VPWIVVSGHRPLYTSTTSGLCNACATAFEAFFNKYNVDLVLAGHVHYYERMWPIAPGGIVTQTNYSQPSAPVYIVNGIAGNVEGFTATPSSYQSYTAFIYNSDSGYGRLNVSSSALQWTFYSSTNSAILDQIVIDKQH